MSDGIELQVDLDHDHPALAVMDAIVQADPSQSRSAIVRRVLREWAEREIHRATVIVRVAGRSGSAAESGRNRGG
jgi:hypothetical protein